MLSASRTLCWARAVLSKLAQRLGGSFEMVFKDENVQLKLCEQHCAKLAVVECTVSDEAVWRERLDSRCRRQDDSAQAHKPKSWEALQTLIDG